MFVVGQLVRVKEENCWGAYNKLHEEFIINKLVTDHPHYSDEILYGVIPQEEYSIFQGNNYYKWVFKKEHLLPVEEYLLPEEDNV